MGQGKGGKWLISKQNFCKFNPLGTPLFLEIGEDWFIVVRRPWLQSSAYMIMSIETQFDYLCDWETIKQLQLSQKFLCLLH